MKRRILFDTLKTQKNIFYARIGTELISSLLVVAAAWETASVVNLVFIEGRGSAETAPDLTVLFLCLLFTALLRMPKARLERRLSDAARLSCRKKLHAALLAERHDVSGLLTLALERVDALDQYFRTVLPTAISFAVLVPLILIVAAILDPLSALLFLATLPIAPFLLYLIGRATRRASERQWDEMSRLTSGFGELIRAAMTLKIFRRSEAEGKHLARMSRSFSEASLRVLRLAFISSFALELITTLSIALIAVSIGLRLVEGMMDFWTAFFVLILAPLFYQPLREGGIAFHAAMEAKTAEEALRPYLSRTVPADGAQSRVLSPPALAASELTYRYPLTEEAVLTHLSIIFPAGKRTVLAGASGTGKTTLLTLLAGLAAPTEGSVRITDGAGAAHAFDLATLSENTKCALVSYVPQEPHIFAATLAENVTLWQENRSPEDAAAALEGAALGDFLRALPQRLDTPLGAGGHPLSAGQRHRLGIARALCAARPVVLLDEPTAGLDAETEERVLQSLTAFAHRRTLIVSSHRPAVMAWADEIITLGGET
ncbi:thiol reductant ABC exporter, CydD subunit [Selenomonas sp. oral taxon 137 str. F0430]|uniref:thiol reductant ABC exporter subunit CydD n=1 Tax=Selenomonas sp. oral taxon 137 TaxID=712531 RepID=UPI0001EB27DF|nr:thiol reductant ABC exporter subunit CydD [Selenomonas sp. oral taxon 137]EFR41399.1 thiol reductant ABC exporter, CydD subunit [Selenomonas sp. oral taxon 137 str. F0430]